MEKLNKIELQNLRTLIKKHEIFSNKLLNFADYAVDPQIKQIFNQNAQEANNFKERLINFFEDEKGK